VLYICGVPGTGKTALVMEMLRGLRPQALQAGAQVVAINCLQLPTPQHVFSRLWEKLSGQHLGPARWVATDTAAQAQHVSWATIIACLLSAACPAGATQTLISLCWLLWAEMWCFGRSAVLLQGM
jgi:Cdc6-like AAA superfamily ATPase